MNATRHAVVGLLFLAALVLLGVVTIKVTSVKDILGQEPYLLEAEFLGSSVGQIGRGGVGGLERGDPVRVAGVEVGRVERVQLAPEPLPPNPALPGAEQHQFKVLVRFRLNKAIRLYEGYRIRITDESLLGGKQIEIDPGLGPETTDTRLKGTLLPSAIESLSEIMDRNAANIGSFLKDLKAISAHVRNGDGTLGRFVMQSEFHDKLVAVAERLDRLLRNVIEGRGLVHAILYDDQLRADVQGFVRATREVADGLASGRGTLGRLLKEETTYNDVREAAGLVRRLLEDVSHGKGVLGAVLADEVVAERFRDFSRALTREDNVLGKILHDRAFARRLESLAANADHIVAQVRRGPGTVHRLIYDDHLVKGLEGAVTAITGTVNEAREAAPVNAFLQAMFAWW